MESEWPVLFLFSGTGVGSMKGQLAAEQGWDGSSCGEEGCMGWDHQ